LLSCSACVNAWNVNLDCTARGRLDANQIRRGHARHPLALLATQHGISAFLRA
jgi:hypothetical protein